MKSRASGWGSKLSVHARVCPYRGKFNAEGFIWQVTINLAASNELWQPAQQEKQWKLMTPSTGIISVHCSKSAGISLYVEIMFQMVHTPRTSSIHSFCVHILCMSFLMVQVCTVTKGLNVFT